MFFHRKTSIEVFWVWTGPHASCLIDFVPSTTLNARQERKTPNEGI
jgi:hypothetical protein